MPTRMRPKPGGRGIRLSLDGGREAVQDLERGLDRSAQRRLVERQEGGLGDEAVGDAERLPAADPERPRGRAVVDHDPGIPGSPAQDDRLLRLRVARRAPVGAPGGASRGRAVAWSDRSMAGRAWSGRAAQRVVRVMRQATASRGRSGSTATRAIGSCRTATGAPSGTARVPPPGWPSGAALDRRRVDLGRDGALPLPEVVDVQERAATRQAVAIRASPSPPCAAPRPPARAAARRGARGPGGARRTPRGRPRTTGRSRRARARGAALPRDVRGRRVRRSRSSVRPRRRAGRSTTSRSTERPDSRLAARLKPSSRSAGRTISSQRRSTPRPTASTGSKTRARSSQAAMAPCSWALATQRSASVVLPLDGPPRKAAPTSRGQPPRSEDGVQRREARRDDLARRGRRQGDGVEWIGDGVRQGREGQGSVGGRSLHPWLPDSHRTAVTEPDGRTPPTRPEGGERAVERFVRPSHGPTDYRTDVLFRQVPKPLPTCRPIIERMRSPSAHQPSSRCADGRRDERR